MAKADKPQTQFYTLHPKGPPTLLNIATPALTKEHGNDKYVVIDDKGEVVAVHDVFEGEGVNRQATGNTKALETINEELNKFKAKVAEEEMGLRNELRHLEDMRAAPSTAEEFQKREADIKQIQQSIRDLVSECDKKTLQFQAKQKKYRIIRTLPERRKSPSANEMAQIEDAYDLPA